MKNDRYDDLVDKISNRKLLMPLDVLLVGGTGTGKSSTLNALFGSNLAKVGDGVDPETQVISSYSLHNYLRIHDSAGLVMARLLTLNMPKILQTSYIKLAL